MSSGKWVIFSRLQCVNMVYATKRTIRWLSETTRWINIDIVVGLARHSICYSHPFLTFLLCQNRKINSGSIMGFYIFPQMCVMNN